MVYLTLVRLNIPEYGILFNIFNLGKVEYTTTWYIWPYQGPIYWNTVYLTVIKSSITEYGIYNLCKALFFSAHQLCGLLCEQECTGDIQRLTNCFRTNLIEKCVYPKSSAKLNPCYDSLWKRRTIDPDHDVWTPCCIIQELEPSWTALMYPKPFTTEPKLANLMKEGK